MPQELKSVHNIHCTNYPGSHDCDAKVVSRIYIPQTVSGVWPNAFFDIRGKSAEHERISDTFVVVLVSCSKIGAVPCKMQRSLHWISKGH